MATLSDEKVTHMTHVILKALLDRDLFDITEEEGVVRKAMKKAIQEQLRIGGDIDAAARKKIESLSKHVPEGSPEWEILYSKYTREEENKRGMGA